MASSELDAAVAKRTQTSLGKFVKRPALTEKLLRKPPFRFLHDIVHAIVREHGLLDGLYTADELNSDNIKDRDSKMAFLQKLIDVVKLTTGQELKVRPSKVVAGLEPERTNELLQALGYALEQKLSSADAVRRYLETTSGKAPEPNGAPPAAPVPTVTNGHAAPTVEPAPPQGRKEKAKEKETAGPGADRKRDRAAKAKEREGLKNGGSNLPEKATKGKPNGAKAVPAASTTESRKKSDKAAAPGGKGKEKEKPLKRISSIPEEQQAVLDKGPGALVNGSEVTNGGKSSEGRKRKDSLKESVGESPPRSLVVEGQLGKTDDEAGEDEQEKRGKSQPGSNNSSRRSSLKKQNSLTASENNALSEMNQFNGLERTPGPSRQDSGATIVGEPVGQDGSDPQEHAGPTASITVMAAAEPKVIGKPPINRQPSVVIDTVMRPRTSLRPPSVRPPSARPGAPRRKEKNVEVILQPNETQKLGDINVKMEVFNSELLDDDGENLIVIEDPTATVDVYGGVVIGTVSSTAGLTGEDGASPLVSHEPEDQQGHLVQQILETQKEFSSHTGTDGEMVRKADMVSRIINLKHTFAR
uniref:TRAF3-interacting protein 1 n=1 Tax=Anopheles atroparvus TaxID=41427 RepID=A0AAG5CXT7_ANOAO